MNQRESDWENPHDPEARITKANDGRTTGKSEPTHFGRRSIPSRGAHKMRGSERPGPSGASTRSGQHPRNVASDELSALDSSNGSGLFAWADPGNV
jgi:hypothetical protein